MWQPAWIGMGGNQGDVPATFRDALEELERPGTTRLVRSSRIYRTQAVGSHAGSDFLNAVAQLETRLEPVEFLDELQRVEDHAGRLHEQRWAPRPLDLDVLLFGEHGQACCETPRLTIPHPHMWYRRFVLDPLAELVPDLIHPQRGRTIAQLLEPWRAPPALISFAGGTTALRSQLLSVALESRHNVHSTSCLDEAALVIWLGPAESGPQRWEDLPTATRLDLTAFPTPPAESLQDVLTSACGCPIPVEE